MKKAAPSADRSASSRKSQHRPFERKGRPESRVCLNENRGNGKGLVAATAAKTYSNVDHGPTG
jgi:hypothetical protein